MLRAYRTDTFIKKHYLLYAGIIFHHCLKSKFQVHTQAP